MKNFMRIFSLALCALTLVSPAMAAQQKLSDKDVKQFVAAIGDVEGFADKLKEEGKDKALEAAVEPESGKEFTPYGNGVELLKKKFPEDYTKLTGLVTKHGFKSPENWASTGDTVMHSYMAVKIEEQNPNAFKEIKEVTPEMKAKMPPEAIQQFERATAMMKLVAAAPAENKAVVKAHMGEIDAWLDRAAKAEAEAAATVPKVDAAPKADAAKPAEKKAE